MREKRFAHYGGISLWIYRTLVVIVWLMFLAPVTAIAQPPALKTPSPVIYLADNLDEKDQLGWCIDTQGRGFSERLHAHSCKPRGGDVQFSYNQETEQIISATYDNKCATLLLPPADGVMFGLLDCSASSDLQSFNYDTDTSEFHPSNHPELCIAVGAMSRTAGPFMSRDLMLSPCDATENKFKQWLFKEE